MVMCKRCEKHEATEEHHIDGDHGNDDPENLMDVCAHCHAELHDMMPNLAEAKVQYENLKDMENTRIRIESRIRGLKRKWGIDTELLEEELKTVKGLEREVEKRLIGAVKGRKILGWLTGIRGIADKTAAELIALIGDIGRFKTIKSLWHYSGLHVVDGEAPRMRKGKQGDYHPKLKSLCLGIVGTNFIRCKSPYCQLYDERKKYYEENRDWGPEKMHKHLAAIRYMVKQFIKNLWLEWRRLEGLPITEPHPRDKPKGRLETYRIVGRPAGTGDAASGPDHHPLETQQLDVPPAGPTITDGDD